MISPEIEVIDLDVFTSDGKVVKAKSSGNVLRGFEKAFIGKEALKLYEILPRVLATCSQSHIYAYASPFLEDKKVIETMVMLEIVESHLRHPYAYWFPHLKLGAEYDFPSGGKFRKVSYYSRKIREVMERIGGKWPHTKHLSEKVNVQLKGEDLKEVVDFVEKEMLGMPLGDFLEVKDLGEMRKGDVGLLVDKAYESVFWNNGVNNYITVGFPFGANFEVSKLRDEGLRVTYDSKPVEVGPLAQALTFDELARKYHEKLGPSPLLREISRFKIIAKLLTLLYHDADLSSSTLRIPDGEYMGLVESIRGSLLHAFKIDNGKVRNYNILQPTTIIASPGGALERSVIGIPVDGIPLAVSSLDTCFVTKVNIYDENNRLIGSKRIGGFC